MTNRERAVLFVLVGTTDVQALIEVSDRSGGAPRMSMARLARVCHEDLDAKAVSFCIERHPELSSAGRGDRFEVAHAGKDDRRWAVHQEGEATTSAQIVYRDEKVVLVPAKLDELVERLKSQYEIGACIVFNTHRERTTGGDEPIAAGRVISDFLAEECGLEFVSAPSAPDAVRDGAAQWVNFLSGEDRMEGAEPESFVNPAMIDRMVKAIAASRAWKARPDVALCALGGGFPNVKPILLAAAELQYGARKTHLVIETERPQQKPRPPGAFTSRKMQYVQKLHARRQCLERIMLGDFVGAGSIAAAEEAWDEALGFEPWCAATQRVADWFARRSPGREVEDRRTRALVSVSFESHWRALTKHDQRIAVYTAFALEAALRQQRIVDALQLTYMIEMQLVQNSCAMCFTTLTFPQPWKAPDWEPKAHALAGFMNSKTASEWHLAAQWSKSAWGELLEAVSKPAHSACVSFGELVNRGVQSVIPSIKKWREYRNQFVHGKLVPEAVTKSHAEAIDLGIWLDPARNDGFCLLGHPTLEPVFEHLGVSDPRKIYREIVASLTALLLQPTA